MDKFSFPCPCYQSKITTGDAVDHRTSSHKGIPPPKKEFEKGLSSIFPNYEFFLLPLDLFIEKMPDPVY
jgi:hypothetical protein